MPRVNPLTRAKHQKAWTHFNRTEHSAALVLYQQIVQRDPADAQAWAMAGIVHALFGAFADADRCLTRAHALDPANIDALANLAALRQRQARAVDAEALYRDLLAREPRHLNGWLGLGNLCAQHDRLTEAQRCYETVRECQPTHLAAQINLANVLAYQGEPLLAAQHYRAALARTPNAAWHSNFLLSLHYADAVPTDAIPAEAIPADAIPADAIPAAAVPAAAIQAAAIFAEHQRWAQRYCAAIQPLPAAALPAAGSRKIRVGYVTPDLREHSVAYFLRTLLRQHDRAGFEIFCYVETNSTDAARSWASHATVRSTLGHNDAEVARQIRADGIDVLVDLAGHTDHNRLPVFAWRPAPVQMTYLGYPDTTGLDRIDYRITDALADPPGLTEALHSETLLRLPDGFLCFDPPAEAPQVSPLPAQTHGHVCFGSFNVLTKLTPAMLELWAEILTGLPDARLLIKNRQLTDPALRERLAARLDALGVAPARVTLLGRTDKASHMATYAQVDIALDSFPYHGTTTTCDTLWMGLPVITLAGTTHVSRVGVSLLTRVGLDDWIACDRNDYVARALRHASDLDALAALRSSLRERTRAALCDAARFTAQLEAAYRDALARVAERHS